MIRHTIITIIAAAWLLTTCCRTAYPDTPADHRVLLDAIRQVESGGNDGAIGDHGRSKGPMQCQRAAWREACQYGKVNWGYDSNVWDRAKSAQVFLWYGARYGAKTDEQFSRIWNGGPRGMSKRATEAYWKRVKETMR